MNFSFLTTGRDLREDLEEISWMMIEDLEVIVKKSPRKRVKPQKSSNATLALYVALAAVLALVAAIVASGVV